MRYRIHRIKESQKEHFRWAPHTGGAAVAKARDYEPAEEVEAVSPYAVWKMLSGTSPLSPGDILETLDGANLPVRLEIFKYIGFEPAAWFLPELKAEANV